MFYCIGLERRDVWRIFLLKGRKRNATSEDFLPGHFLLPIFSLFSPPNGLFQLRGSQEELWGENRAHRLCTDICPMFSFCLGIFTFSCWNTKEEGNLIGSLKGEYTNKLLSLYTKVWGNC